MASVGERAPELLSPRPRRVPVPGWLDVRLVLGVALVLGSVLVGASVLNAARRTSPAVAARHDLAAGTVLAADDLRIVQVRLPAAASYPTELADVIGKQLSRAVQNGELVPRGALDARSAETTVTVPLPAAAAPELRKGNRIELWLSVGRCPTTVLLPDVTVQAVHADAGAFGAGADGQAVVISVSPELAERVITALALEDAQLRAGILNGPPATTGPTAALPDARGCAADGR
jgi:hypothetical protein